MDEAAQAADGVQGVWLVQAKAPQRRQGHLEHAGLSRLQFGVGRILESGRAHPQQVQPGILFYVAAVGPGNGAHRLRPGLPDGGLGHALPQLAGAEQGQLAAQAGQAVDVVVEGGGLHPQVTGQGAQRERLPAGGIHQRRSGGHHLNFIELLTRHVFSFLELLLPGGWEGCFQIINEEP